MDVLHTDLNIRWMIKPDLEQVMEIDQLANRHAWSEAGFMLYLLSRDFREVRD